MQDFRGKQIDRYQIIEQLGQGGMATVYKAYDLTLVRNVAVKIIRTDDMPASQYEHLLKRFEREAQSQAKFSHPNIVPIYDYGQFNGIPYLVMAYLPGGTLKSKINGPTDLQRSLEIVVPIADALAYAHELDILHRDVKPSNILFDSVGRPLLADFGIAKILEVDGNTLTGTGLGVGTPEYMSPEQWQGKASASSDQYSLAVVLYELLTGIKPYTADTPIAIALKQMSEPFQPPSDLIEGLPDEFENVLYKALARDPEDRFENIAEFGQALAPFMETKWQTPSLSHASNANPAYRSSPTASSEKPTYDSIAEKQKIPSEPRSGKRDKPITQPKGHKKIPPWVLGVIIVPLIAVIGILLFWNKLLGIGSGNETDPYSTTSPNTTSDPTQTTVNRSTATSKPTEKTQLVSGYVTPTPKLYYPLTDCAASALHIGDSAFITYDTGINKLRSEPDTSLSDNFVGEVGPGETVIIIGGPVCNYGWVLWEVQTTRNETGWTPETNGKDYWMLPLTTRDLCDGALPSRLVVGDMAKVMEEPDSANLIRTEPSRFDDVIARIQPGNWMRIVDGPYCGEKTTWWKVEDAITGIIGWTMEGDLETYYLAPEP